MISTDRRIFETGSQARARQIEYAKKWGEVDIVIFEKVKSKKEKDKTTSQNLKGESQDLKSVRQSSLTPHECSIAPNCFVYSTRSRFKILYPFDAIRLGRFICKSRGITNITCQDSSLTAMAGLALKKEFKIPLEIQMHEDMGSPYYTRRISNRIRKMLALKYLPQADHIRVVSNRIRTYITDILKVDSSKIEVRPITVDVEWIRNAPISPAADLHRKYPQFEKIVLMASRLEKEKNIGAAIEAWPEVIKLIPKVGLVIVGSGTEISNLKSSHFAPRQLGASRDKQISKLRSQQLTAAVGDSIIFEPWADQATLASYYKTADLFLNVSLFEGYGMTLVEAQAAGCKIVSTDVGIAPEVGAIITKPDSLAVAKAVIGALT
jgi:glycosyltransferase involved in cell wall biosynthesis